MNKYMILCAVGKNRLGIVDDVTTFLLEKNTNIEDSSMITLGGRFSIMCLFSCSSEALENVKDGLENLIKLGLTTALYEAENPELIKSEDRITFTLDVISMDYPGIVQKIVHILKEHNVCINSLDTQTGATPHSGAPLFDLKLKADIPASQTIDRIREELNNIASDLNLDMTLITDSINEAAVKK